MCAVCGRKIRANDGRRSVTVGGSQRLVHRDRDRGFDCLDVVIGWMVGGADLSREEAAALGRLEEGIGPLTMKEEAMGDSFKDSYNPDEAPKPEGGDFPPFATEDEKKTLAEDGTRLDVSAVRFGTSRHGGVAHLDVESVPKNRLPRLTDESGKKLPPGRTLTFSYQVEDGGVVTRDHLIGKLAEWLPENEGETVPIRIVKQGRTYLIELI